MLRLRQQPSAALLSFLHARLATFDAHEFQRHQDTCDLMVELLPPSLLVPGWAAPVRNHWLFPVLVPAGRVEHMLRRLNDQGIDAYRGATQLALVPMPEECKGRGQQPVRSARTHTGTRREDNGGGVWLAPAPAPSLIFLLFSSPSPPSFCPCRFKLPI
jgi:hypothetical protein